MMGSCVSKKAARAGAKKGKVAAPPLPVVEKEGAHHALPPVVEEEVKEVVLSETPVARPPRPRPEPEPEPVKRRQDQPPGPETEDEAASEACSASDSASVASAPKEKAKPQTPPQIERAEARKTAMPDEKERKANKGVGAGNGRARSPSSHRRQPGAGSQQQRPAAPRPHRREQPAVVSGIGCRSGRFSPSAARRAAESAVRRTHSAREADMALPSKRSLMTAAIGGSGHGTGSGALSRRDPGERSGRRSDSPTGGRRAPASPSAAIHRAASPVRGNGKAAKDHAQQHGHHCTPEGGSRPTRVRDGGDEQPKKAAPEGEALGQNPSVAMECFIFL